MHDLPPGELDEDLLPGLDLLHRVGQAEEAGLGLASLAILNNQAARGCKRRTRSVSHFGQRLIKIISTDEKSGL